MVSKDKPFFTFISFMVFVKCGVFRLVLPLFVPYLSCFGCLLKAVLRHYGISFTYVIRSCTFEDVDYFKLFGITLV